MLSRHVSFVQLEVTLGNEKDLHYYMATLWDSQSSYPYHLTFTRSKKVILSPPGMLPVVPTVTSCAFKRGKIIKPKSMQLTWNLEKL